jgi:hypothetical protein
MLPAQVDFRSLSERPSREQLASVRSDGLAGAFGEPTAARLRTATRDGWLVLALIGGFITAIFAITTLVRWIQGESAGDTLAGVVLTVFVALVCFAAYTVARYVVSPMSWRATVRLVGFARANGMAVEPVSDGQPPAGTLNERKRNYRTIARRVSWQQGGMEAEAAQFSDAAYGRTADIFHARYLAIRLPVDRPRASFISGRSGLVNPDIYFGVDALTDDAARRGGRRVRLICDAGSQDAVRAIFTDRLIDVLTDRRRPANAEIRGRWFLAYYRDNGFNANEHLWRRTLDAVELVAETVTAQKA